jgi:hypothetical protein
MVGGQPYEDWKNGHPFVRGMELREHTCPAWWYQSANYALKPDWPECSERWGLPFHDCRHFAAKHKCWQRFDDEDDARRSKDHEEASQ